MVGFLVKEDVAMATQNRAYFNGLKTAQNYKWTIIEFCFFSGRIYRFFHVFPMTYGGFQ